MSTFELFKKRDRGVPLIALANDSWKNSHAIAFRDDPHLHLEIADYPCLWILLFY